MIVEIDTRLFDVQMLLSRFVVELLETAPGNLMNVDVRLPVVGEAGVDLLPVSQVQLHTGEGTTILIRGKSTEFCTWDDLDVASQYVLANSLHQAYVAGKLYGGGTAQQ
ncbi:MAG: hypothetical protein JXA20_04455 [Spirochaetes bacterium]|nr:hypothetical protein [Spirochaetota bacterium]